MWYRLSVTLLAAATLTSCVTAPLPVPREQAEQCIDEVVEDATEYIEQEDTAHSAGLLEQHREIGLASDPNYELDPRGQYLLAFSYIANFDLDNAETEFRSLVGRFEKNPLIVEEIHHKLEDFLKSEEHRAVKQDILGYTGTLPRLHAVYAFICLVEHDFEGARDGYRAALPHFQNKYGIHHGAINNLLIHAQNNHRPDLADGYARVLGGFNTE